jgi:hypothetical protein
MLGLALKCQASVRESWQLPLVEELEAGRLVEAAQLQGLAKVTRLGTSAGGRPIDMISIGEGPHEALIVGAPHANEPIGCLTIKRLLKRLGNDAHLREHSGYRWHLIPAIDIDGIALNEGWFRGELALDRYLANFYRPPFALQPEYSFPLTVEGYEFTRSTPENLCWQRALELTRPTLQCSLHGADYGGAFFILSHEQRNLSAELAALPQKFSIVLDELGEPGADLEPIRPGVFAFPSIANMIGAKLKARIDPQLAWGAGDSSAGFARKRYGTFSMTCEIPLWDDVRLGNSRLSKLTMASVLDEETAELEEDKRVLGGLLPELRGRASGFEQRALLASLEEADGQSGAQLEEIEGLNQQPAVKQRLRYKELVQYQPGTAGMRTLAMAVRLARSLGIESSAAERVLSSRMRSYLRDSRMRPVNLGFSSGLQMEAVLRAARLLA